MSVYSKIYEDKIKEIELDFQSHKTNTSLIIHNMFTTTVIGSFTWKGIPDFIKTVPDFIEESLYEAGKIAYFRIDDNVRKIDGVTIPESLENGDYVAPAFANGRLLKNGLYSKYTMIFRDGTTVILPVECIELGFNNFSAVPSSLFVQEYVDKCSNALSAVDVSLYRAMLPTILSGKDEQTVNKIIEAIDKSYKQKSPFCVSMLGYTEDEIKKEVLYDDREVGIINIWDIFVRYKNLFFTNYGVNNVEISKQERLTLGESQSNTEITRYSVFWDMFEHRREFCERVKEHFGVEISCEINRNIDTVVEFNLTTQDKIDMKNKMISPYEDMTVTKKSAEDEEEKTEEKEEKGGEE